MWPFSLSIWHIKILFFIFVTECLKYIVIFIYWYPSPLRGMDCNCTSSSIIFQTDSEMLHILVIGLQANAGSSYNMCLKVKNVKSALRASVRWNILKYWHSSLLKKDVYLFCRFYFRFIFTVSNLNTELTKYTYWNINIAFGVLFSWLL